VVIAMLRRSITFLGRQTESRWMERFWTPARLLAALVVAALPIVPAAAQDIEPRAYSNAPIGYNFLVTGLAFTRGGLAFNPSLPLTNPDLNTVSAVAAYARVIELGGQSAKLEAVVPYTSLSGTADYRGQQVSRDINGLANPSFRLSVNLHGAPALSAQEFGAWQQDLIVGVSLRVAPPWGQYDSTRLVNIGTNRWSFKPELGASQTFGQWTVEGALAATFFTTNHEFWNGNTLSQDPLVAARGHVIYGFANGMWLSVDATWYAGGRTTVNGVLNNDLQQNWRLGSTLAFPIDRAFSIKLYASSGVSDRTGNSFDLLGLALQYRWL
jgi:hypothetical protein